ncbi:MAG: hypothetical protein DME76_15335 [Verrucomicrobia bacterium]|nr:MAG: hypothetical protein DME76_15335 [Verrucomicrobiota bacterium]
MTAEEIAQEIAQFLVDRRAILFAGAGVGARVGLPTWPQWLEHLAAVCRKYNDPLAADLIQRRVEEQDFLGAAVISSINPQVRHAPSQTRSFTLLIYLRTQKRTHSLKFRVLP